MFTTDPTPAPVAKPRGGTSCCCAQDCCPCTCGCDSGPCCGKCVNCCCCD